MKNNCFDRVLLGYARQYCLALKFVHQAPDAQMLRQGISIVTNI